MSSGSDSGDPGGVNEGLVAVKLIVCVVCLANLGFLVWYYGWVWTMTHHAYRFNSWSFVPVPDPASWIDNRFNLDWTLYAFMIFQLFPIYVMFWILGNPESGVRYDLHALAVIAGVLVCAILLLWYILVAWFWQNNSTLWPWAVPNSVQYCCKNYGAVASVFGCGNFHDCVDLPTTPTIRLHTDEIFEKHLLAIVICFVFLIAQVFINSMVRRYVQNNQPSSSSSSSSSSSDQGLPITTARGGGGSYDLGLSSAPSDMGPYFLHGVNIIYMALLCVFLTCGLLVLDVRHTHEFPAVGPVGIRSARNGVEAVGLVMSATIILLPALVLMLMAFSGTRWLSNVIFALILLLVLVHLFSFATMLYSRGTANRPGHPNSMANHPLRCCAGDVFIDPSSDCDNAGTCNLPVAPFQHVVLPLSSSQVPFNPTHNLIFWIMFVLLILDVVSIMLAMNLYVGKQAVRQAGSALIQAMWAPRIASRQFFTAAVQAAGFKKFDHTGKLE
jgi:hypothetical protein